MNTSAADCNINKILVKDKEKGIQNKGLVSDGEFQEIIESELKNAS